MEGGAQKNIFSRYPDPDRTDSLGPRVRASEVSSVSSVSSPTSHKLSIGKLDNRDVHEEHQLKSTDKTRETRVETRERDEKGKGKEKEKEKEGRVVEVTADGRQIVRYRNGTTKETRPDGTVEVRTESVLNRY